VGARSARAGPAAARAGHPCDAASARFALVTCPIAVFRDKELSGDYPIDARGYVQTPGLGVIKAAGLDRPR
jgi:hypothetical protein